MSSNVTYVQGSSCSNDNVVRILFQTGVRILHVHGYSNQTRVLLQRRHELINWKGKAVIRWIPSTMMVLRRGRSSPYFSLKAWGLTTSFPSFSNSLTLGILKVYFLALFLR